MKCPHCLKVCRALVLETRSTEDSLLRRRQCSGCGRTYVSQETASADLRIPRKRTPERKAAEREARRVSIDRGPAGSGQHLSEVWR